MHWQLAIRACACQLKSGVGVWRKGARICYLLPPPEVSAELPWLGGVHWVVAQHLPAPIAFFIKHVVKRIVPSQRSGSICKMALRGESLTMVALASESFRGGGRVSTD